MMIMFQPKIDQMSINISLDHDIHAIWDIDQPDSVDG